MRFLCIFLVFILHLPHVFWSCYPLTYIVLIIGDIYIYICVLMYVIHLSFHLLFIFLLYTYVSYIMYAILYFCFTLRSLNEFVCFVSEIQVVKVYLP